jgi:hypothetical protein
MVWGVRIFSCYFGGFHLISLCPSLRFHSSPYFAPSVARRLILHSPRRSLHGRARLSCPNIRWCKFDNRIVFCVLLKPVLLSPTTSRRDDILAIPFQLILALLLDLLTLLTPLPHPPLLDRRMSVSFSISLNPTTYLTPDISTHTHVLFSNPTFRHKHHRLCLRCRIHRMGLRSSGHGGRVDRIVVRGRDGCAAV